MYCMYVHSITPSVRVSVCLCSGEGAMPQEYTIIKLEVLRPFPAGHPLASPLLEGKAVYLAPATLRPETFVPSPHSSC